MKDLPLHAGPLRMTFESSTGFIRHLRLGRSEIVRAIYGAVRDRNWGTVSPRFENLEVTHDREQFRITFAARCQAPEIQFTWLGELTGQPDGTVRVVFDGRAETACLRNRIGLCLLHPIRECAGAPCRIERVDRSLVDGEFPRFISPHQPFKNLRAITHFVNPDWECTVRMEGDTFEMEDQRNWTDASFKTYSTPLELPFPVRLDAGARVRQEVSVSLRHPGGHPITRLPTVQSSHPVANPAVQIAWDQPIARPRVGFGMARHRLAKTSLQRLAELKPDHLRADLAFAGTGWKERMVEASKLAAALDCSLHFALFLTQNAADELTELRARVRALGVPVSLWMVFDSARKTTPEDLVRLATDILGEKNEPPLIAAGTNAYFAELNRSRLPADLAALTCYSFNPQVHAFDDLSLIETLGAQRATVESAQQFRPQPVVLSPITLRPRFNPNATEPEVDPKPEADSRQSTDFGALWTLGTLGRLLPCPGVHSLDLFETHGPRGLMSDNGEAFPMARVFGALVGFDHVCEAISTDPLDVAVLALRSSVGHARLLLGNFRHTSQRVSVDLPEAAVDCRLATADTGVMLSSTGDHHAEVHLPSHGLAIVDLVIT